MRLNRMVLQHPVLNTEWEEERNFAPDLILGLVSKSDQASSK
jgi:hypothetical protein